MAYVFRRPWRGNLRHNKENNKAGIRVGGRQTYTLAENTGTYALTGSALTPKLTIKLPEATGTYALTGSAASLLKKFVLSEATGTYALTGSALATLTTRKLSATTGTYALTGQTATVVVTRKLAAATGTYALTGSTAAAFATRKLAGVTGTYFLTGSSAPLKRTLFLSLASGAYSLTGSTAATFVTRKLAGVTGAYALTGSAATTIITRRLAAASGAYALTGSAAQVFASRKLSAASGSYLLNGQTATLVLTPGSGSATFTLAGDTGHYVLSGSSGTLTFVASTPTSGNIYTVSGPQVIGYLPLQDGVDQVRAVNFPGSTVQRQTTDGTTAIVPVFQSDFTAISSLPASISFSRASTATYFDSSGVLQIAAINAPRFDYDPSTLAAKGLLIEEARTNLIPTSNPLTNAAWTSNLSCGKAASGNNSPDGTANATTVTPTAVLGSFLYQGFVASSTGTYTASISLRVTSGTGLAYLSLQDANSSSTTSVACNLTTTWARFEVSRTCTSGNNPFLLVGNSYANTNASASFEAFGGDIEQGAFATSYIPTTTVAVTRSLDMAQLTGAALTALQAASGSLIVENTLEHDQANTPIIASTSGADSIWLYVHSTGPYSAATYNGTQIVDSATIASFIGTHREGISWSGAGRTAVVDGGTVGTDANAGNFAGTGAATLGRSAAVATLFDGWYRSIAVYNTRLPDATLQAKSVVGAAF